MKISFIQCSKYNSLGKNSITHIFEGRQSSENKSPIIVFYLSITYFLIVWWKLFQSPPGFRVYMHSHARF